MVSRGAVLHAETSPTDRPEDVLQSALTRSAVMSRRRQKATHLSTPPQSTQNKAGQGWGVPSTPHPSM